MERLHVLRAAPAAGRVVDDRVHAAGRSAAYTARFILSRSTSIHTVS
jgi:hypothetical protein